MGGKGRIVLAFLILVIISLAGNAEAVSISPSELTVKNLDERKDYQFIVLIESSQEGLVDVELKSSHSSITFSPDKIMLNEGEQRSVRLHLDPKAVEDDLDNIRVQPYVNDVPTEDRLNIFFRESEQNETAQPSTEPEKESYHEPAVFTLIIYGLIFIVAAMIIIIFLPEIRKNIKTAKAKSIDTSDKRFYKRSKARMENVKRRVDKSDKRVKKIIQDIESFHENAHNWVSEKSGGRYGLE
ncbi:MAG: hypothetical protein ACLFSL_01085 [Candidatus Woesearchaeota archaeon]